MKVLASYSAFPDIILPGEGWAHHYSLRVKVQVPYSAFPGMGGAGASFFCGVQLEYNTYCLRVFCLARKYCPFPGPVTRKSRLSGGFCCCCWSASIGISRLLASSAPTLSYMRQKDNSGNSPPVCLLLTTLQNLPFSFIYHVQSFQLYLARRIGKSLPTPSSQKQRSSKILYTIAPPTTGYECIWSLYVYFQDKSNLQESM